MSRCVVSVATGRYVPGMDRLQRELGSTRFMGWRNTMPPGSPSHLDVPYAFKAWALKAAADAGHTVLLWADACILPILNLEPLWDKIERDGAWISRNGWTNAQWTADSAYPDLGVTREQNATIEHVVATTFGLNLKNPVGERIFQEYLRLAQTKAFCGPWWNNKGPYSGNHGAAPCGPETIFGHRHDQTALSVLAWRYGVELTSAPEWFAYREQGKAPHPTTVLLADANY